jgi:hypothetical protein
MVENCFGSLFNDTGLVWIVLNENCFFGATRRDENERVSAPMEVIRDWELINRFPMCCAHDLEIGIMEFFLT